MTISTSAILPRCSERLQDAGFVRWTTVELLRHLYDGVQALITARPDVYTTTTTIIPVAGARQTLPSDAIALVDVLNNTATSKRAVTKVSQALLEATNRDWMSATGSDISLNYMYDLRTPRTWYVYPPASGTGSVDLVYSVFPTEVTVVGGGYDISQQWQNVLLDYVLGRAYAKDAEYGGNATMSAAHMAAFNKGISDQESAVSTFSPKQ